MLKRLNESHTTSLDADIVVIGGGTVGLPTAVQLAEAGNWKVVCLESGDVSFQSEMSPLNRVVHRGTRYNGAVNGRKRCLGGTSSCWGGALIPFQDADTEPEDWPIGGAELASTIKDVERLFKLDHGPYENSGYFVDPDTPYTMRLAKKPAFAHRNVANLLRSRVNSLENLDVWLNAHVTDLCIVDEKAHVTASSPSGGALDFSASRLIIAGGALETTRLALLLDRSQNNAISNMSPSLGRYFSDHICAEVGAIEPIDITRLNLATGIHVGKSGQLASPRFEMVADGTYRNKLPPHYAFIDVDTNSEDGFSAARTFFRSVQKGGHKSSIKDARLLESAPWMAKAFLWSVLRKRVPFPLNADLVCKVVIEQIPRESNRIALSHTQTDDFGIPLAEIDWRVSEDDIEYLKQASAFFKDTWDSSLLSELGSLRSYGPDALESVQDNPIDTFHPTGSTRMAAGPQGGVVDRDLRLFRYPQVRLLATSVFPRGAGANPTMMLMQLGFRMVDQLSRELRAERSA